MSNSKYELNKELVQMLKAFMEHEKMLSLLGVQSFEIRQKKDLEQEFDGLILPGGESTVMGKLLKELNLFNIIKKK